MSAASIPGHAAQKVEIRPSHECEAEGTPEPSPRSRRSCLCASRWGHAPKCSAAVVRPTGYKLEHQPCLSEAMRGHGAKVIVHHYIVPPARPPYPRPLPMHQAVR